MAAIRQEIPHRVTVYHDSDEQEKELKNAMLPEKPRYFNGHPTYRGENLEEFKDRLDALGMSVDM
ncbi:MULTISPECIES: hypothetical protein [Vibrio]|uniref:Uncharacterized protein n=1 Tax=Vibrio proteolyticus NBRC 13287 TaxID=1219065 RepID=U3B649_VIBPR|nr:MULTISPECIES: hypothetical protein [Vibrio]NAW60161.1 hypothetical protein [Vibrio sp. V36_P2S2PM302]NAX21453.1 hypothetical protein [Vibrio sp. V39_P1S14PM300]NAX26340.1 hypothetical protein [Vibrio sp. V38_P2S17PM301]NAX32053.1 hypothetical protein [Vibrio sp. V37_P2S8PM304]GAD65309.1 hypothetical protein VPR01S_01_00810 [Vibrio proteolyticus NBRC 13287]